MTNKNDSTEGEVDNGVALDPSVRQGVRLPEVRPGSLSEFRAAVAAGDITETRGLSILNGMVNGLVCNRCNSVAWNSGKVGSRIFRAAMLNHLRECSLSCVKVKS